MAWRPITPPLHYVIISLFPPLHHSPQFPIFDNHEALVCHKKALEIDQRIGYPQGEGEDFFNIGEIYQHLQAYEEARRYFSKALEIFQHLDLQAPMEKVVEHLTEIENLT